jgi:hypothetical protein
MLVNQLEMVLTLLADTEAINSGNQQTIESLYRIKQGFIESVFNSIGRTQEAVGLLAMRTAEEEHEMCNRERELEQRERELEEREREVKYLQRVRELEKCEYELWKREREQRERLELEQRARELEESEREAKCLQRARELEKCEYEQRAQAPHEGGGHPTHVWGSVHLQGPSNALNPAGTGGVWTCAKTDWGNHADDDLLPAVGGGNRRHDNYDSFQGIELGGPPSSVKRPFDVNHPEVAKNFGPPIASEAAALAAVAAQPSEESIEQALQRVRRQFNLPPRETH